MSVHEREAMPLPSEPVTQRGRRTRALLVRAARDVFERDGFNAARITDIASVAGVAAGTFYNYFDSKEQAFSAVLRDARCEMLSGNNFERASGNMVPVRESIERANRTYLLGYQRNHRIMVIWEQAATFNSEFHEMLTESRRQFVARWEHKIRELQNAGDADMMLDPHYAAVALCSMTSHFAYVWFVGRETFDLERAVATLTSLWYNALGLR
jgi:AcrR family transcriptional regulator